MAFRGERVPACDSARPQGSEPAGRTRRKSIKGIRFSLDPRGQSLVEFAISAPVVLLMVLFGVDFGRVFLGWVSLNNAVRVAANFAAINPTAWTAPGNPAVVTEYERLITAEATGINCTLPGTLPDPSFPNGTDVGSPAVVAITCQFSLITPLISGILGSAIDVSASSSFPVRSGAIAGTGSGGGPLPSIGPVLPSVAPTPSSAPTPSPAPTPVPMCTVPNLKNKDSSVAIGAYWVPAGFTAGNLIFIPLVPTHYKIRTQSIAFNSSVPCSSSMSVTP